MTQEKQFILKGAGFSYPSSPKTVLRGIDMEIRAGEWVAVLGSNGSGKSTLLKLLSALLFPTQGLCFVGASPSSALTRQQMSRAAAIVFQNPEDQIVASTVEEETAFGPENLGLPSREIISRVKEALTATGLAGFEKRLVSSLSGGQKQRLALAGALAMKPRAILLDEAMSMLDPQSRADFTHLVAAEHKDGKTIVQVTHRLEEIRLSHRVVLLCDGVVALDLPTGEFLKMSAAELARLNLNKPPLERLAEGLAGIGLFDKESEISVESITNTLCRSL